MALPPLIRMGGRWGLGLKPIGCLCNLPYIYKAIAYLPFTHVSW